VSAREPHEMSAAQLSAAYSNRTLSPVEVTEALLARIEALDTKINSFCCCDPGASKEQARQSERRWLEGAPLSPLDGVPVAIKDLLLTSGWPTRRGSLTTDPKGPWDVDAPSVARLREAGAVLIGKTTTPEFGWKATTDSPLTGITRNPWNAEKTPGGSSGGSAAALAARFCPLALGTDGGGSIRIPAALSGVVGLKPSFGRVPAYPLSPFGTVAHIGPMSRTVLDAAMLLNVIGKPDARDWQALPYQATDYAEGLEFGMRGKRIAFSPRLGHVQRIVPEVEHLGAATARRFEKMGAHVEQIDPPGGDVIETFKTLWWSSAAFLLRELPEEKKEQLDPGLRQIAEDGAKISLDEYLSANAARGRFGSAMRQFMERHDFLLTPAVATPAFEAGQLSPIDEDGEAWLHWTPFTYPFNLTHQPAASVPCGFTRDGLPVGLQIVGCMFDDLGVLAAAAAYELADPHFEKVPAGF
jgi:aspartyl-tRNA(Asn)/glutamyl-tRNA(Gln) amidotransferase subunit A